MCIRDRRFPWSSFPAPAVRRCTRRAAHAPSQRSATAAVSSCGSWGPHDAPTLLPRHSTAADSAGAQSAAAAGGCRCTAHAAARSAAMGTHGCSTRFVLLLLHSQSFQCSLWSVRFLPIDTQSQPGGSLTRFHVGMQICMATLHRTFSSSNAGTWPISWCTFHGCSPLARPSPAPHA